MKTIFRKEYLLMGAAMSPHEASLLLRGLRTLPFRMQGHQENSLKIAKFLHNHPKVEKVNFPGLEGHPDYQLGKSQLSGYSGLMSIELKQADFNYIIAVINKMKIFKIGVSWGSFESLIISPNLGNNEGKLVKEHISPGTIRLAIGLENANALIEDLEQALSE